VDDADLMDSASSKVKRFKPGANRYRLEQLSYIDAQFDRSGMARALEMLFNNESFIERQTGALLGWTWECSDQYHTSKGYPDEPLQFDMLF
jgi:hypothetical protein